ncbi:MAG: CotH kinase family protein [Clostridia bacterium]|nr:CotH kinase family protein [Clostridia bacterium]
MWHGRKPQKWLCVCLAVIVAVPSFCFLLGGAFAVEPSVPAVHTVDIGIRPTAYRALISNEAEPRLSVQLAVDGGAYFGGRIKARGGASKLIGLMTPGKRVPMELKTDQSDLFAESLDNSCVKLINSWTPLRLFGEYLALEMYRFMQIPTPAYALTFLRFNGVDFGLYLAAEEVNAECLRKIDPDGGGTLFKAHGSDYDASCWFGSLRIIENRGLERTDALMAALSSGEGYEEYLDVDEALRYFACLAVWGAEDTILTETKPSNFFLYDTGERFILIPWDSSEAFSAYDAGNGIDHFQRDSDKENDDFSLFALLMKKEEYKRIYHDYIRQINDGFFSQELLDARFNALADAVNPYLERDFTMLCNRPEEIPAALETLRKIHENLSAQLNGETEVYNVDPGIFATSDEDGEGAAEEEEKDAEDELNESILFLARNDSPRLDPDITEKICAAYPSWRRTQGQIPFDADDPVEIAVAALVFLSVFFALIILFHKKTNKN